MIPTTSTTTAFLYTYEVCSTSARTEYRVQEFEEARGRRGIDLLLLEVFELHLLLYFKVQNKYTRIYCTCILLSMVASASHTPTQNKIPWCTAVQIDRYRQLCNTRPCHPIVYTMHHTYDIVEREYHTTYVLRI